MSLLARLERAEIISHTLFRRGREKPAAPVASLIDLLSPEWKAPRLES